MQQALAQTKIRILLKTKAKQTYLVKIQRMFDLRTKEIKTLNLIQLKITTVFSEETKTHSLPIFSQTPIRIKVLIPQVCSVTATINQTIFLEGSMSLDLNYLQSIRIKFVAAQTIILLFLKISK